MPVDSMTLGMPQARVSISDTSIDETLLAGAAGALPHHLDCPQQGGREANNGCSRPGAVDTHTFPLDLTVWIFGQTAPRKLPLLTRRHMLSSILAQ
jgi:hypothetical protein